MSYIEENLMQGEVLAYSSQQSIYHFASKLSITAILIVAFVFFRGNWIAATFFASLSLSVFFYVCWNMHATEFGITDQRIIVKRGIFNTKSIELNFNAIESIEVSQKYSEKIFNIGNITITGNGGQREEINGVEHPKRFKEIFLDQRQKYISRQNSSNR